MVTTIRVQTDNPNTIACDERVVFDFSDVDWTRNMPAIEMWHARPEQKELEHRMDERAPDPIRMHLEPDGLHRLEFIDRTTGQRVRLSVAATNRHFAMDVAHIIEGMHLTHVWDAHEITKIEELETKCTSCDGSGFHEVHDEAESERPCGVCGGTGVRHELRRFTLADGSTFDEPKGQALPIVKASVTPALCEKHCPDPSDGIHRPGCPHAPGNAPMRRLQPIADDLHKALSKAPEDINAAVAAVIGRPLTVSEAKELEDHPEFGPMLLQLDRTMQGLQEAGIDLNKEPAPEPPGPEFGLFTTKEEK